MFPLCERESCCVNKTDHKLKPRPVARPAAIRAELVGSNACTALGITVRGYAPVLSLCRKLIDTGIDQATVLHVYRGDLLCLIVRSINTGAHVEINAKGTGFIGRRAVRTAPPAAWLARARA